MFTILIILLLIDGCNTVSIGIIHYASMITSDLNMTINGSNCDECLCKMLSLSMFSLNCFTKNNDSVICQIFSDEIYLGSNASQLKINLSSTFYFRRNNQSAMTTTQTITTSKATLAIFSTAQSPPVCSSSGRGTLSSLNGTIPSSWTQYSYNYTASSTTLTLIFGFQTEPARTYYLDDVSIVDVNLSNVQLLNNPSFENSTTIFNGWTSWCSSSCSGSGGKLYTNNKCHLSTGVCFGANCPGPNAIIFLGQSFPTIIGHIYTISYWLIASGGIQNTNYFYVDVN